jgi:hypothetical protein
MGKVATVRARLIRRADSAEGQGNALHRLCELETKGKHALSAKERAVMREAAQELWRESTKLRELARELLVLPPASSSSAASSSSPKRKPSKKASAK